MNWCYNKSDLLKYCKKYKEITDFWNEILPDFILNIQYEDLISDTKNEVNKILKFCNLPWEDNCLLMEKPTLPAPQIIMFIFN